MLIKCNYLWISIIHSLQLKGSNYMESPYASYCTATLTKIWFLMKKTKHLVYIFLPLYAFIVRMAHIWVICICLINCYSETVYSDFTKFYFFHYGHFCCHQTVWCLQKSSHYLWIVKRWWQGPAISLSFLSLLHQFSILRNLKLLCNVFIHN